jgi:hypothetical protein
MTIDTETERKAFEATKIAEEKMYRQAATIVEGKMHAREYGVWVCPGWSANDLLRGWLARARHAQQETQT